MCPIRNTTDSDRLCLSETLKTWARKLMEKGKENIKQGAERVYIGSGLTPSF